MTPSLIKHPRPSQWLAWDEGGHVSVLTGKAEIGQALQAALAGWVAQSLDWPAERIRVCPPDTSFSPDEGVTSGSLSMQDSGRTLACVARVVRERLRLLAAQRWGIAPSQVQCHQGALRGPEGREAIVTPSWAADVLHEPVTAAELAALAGASDAETPVAPAPDGLGDVAPAAGTVLAVDAARVARHAQLAALLRGEPQYLHDLRWPGLLEGCVLHRVGGAWPDPQARDSACPGVRQVVADGGLLGVLADGAGRAERAARRLAERMSGDPSPASTAWDPTDPQGWEALDAPARLVDCHPALNPPVGAPTAPSPEDGAGEAPLQAPEGGRLIEATYTRGWLAHASIGPSCAVAQWSEDLSRLEVWSHTQGVFNLRRDLALAWGLDETAVVVRHRPGAGCYGHNGADDVAFDASWLARHAAGRPVRVQWLREQEWRSAPLGPAMRVRVQAALDAQGRIVEWRHTVWSPGHSSRPGRSATSSLVGNSLRQGGAPLPAPIDMPLSTGGGGERNAVPGYAWPAWRVLAHRVSVPWRASALRSLGAHVNVFAAEGLLDEIAHATGQCPWTLRLQALGHDPRAQAVLRRAREASRWDERRAALPVHEGAGLGLAFARYKNTGAWCAVVAEVQAEAALRVRRLTIVADVGQVIHPEGVMQQLEGGAVQAVSWTLKEAVAADERGSVAPATWDDYRIIGFDEVPEIDVHLMPSAHPPLGAGEAACGPTAAAIGNALFDALGVRVRDMPLSPARIVAAMNA